MHYYTLSDPWIDSSPSSCWWLPPYILLISGKHNNIWWLATQSNRVGCQKPHPCIWWVEDWQCEHVLQAIFISHSILGHHPKSLWMWSSGRNAFPTKIIKSVQNKSVQKSQVGRGGVGRGGAGRGRAKIPTSEPITLLTPSRSRLIFLCLDW